MLAIELHRGAARVHERVLEASFDSLATQLAHLHRPFHCDGENPTCHGCDRDAPEPDDAPVWPCRTYTLIAKTVLRVPDVEQLVVGLGTQSQAAQAASGALDGTPTR